MYSKIKGGTHMKKKIVSLLISLTMAIGLLSGCGSSSTSGGTTDAGARQPTIWKKQWQPLPQPKTAA